MANKNNENLSSSGNVIEDNPNNAQLTTFESTDSDIFYNNNNNKRKRSSASSGGFLQDGSLVDENDEESNFTGGAGWPSGILIMANVCLGMGILNFPRIFYEAGGITVTLISLAIFVVLIAGSLYIIAYCCRYYACVNYQDMVRVHCGRYFGLVCSVSLFFELTGSLIVKMVVLSDQLDRLYSIASGSEFTKHYYLMPIVAIVIFLPMCFIRDFTCFKYVSVGGVLAALYITFGVSMVGYILKEPGDPELFIETKDQTRDFNLLIPLLVYGYHGHVEAPLVFSGIKKQKLHNFMKTVYSYLFISTVCYAVTGVFGYLTFGRTTDVDFLLNYPKDNWFANVAILIVSFKLFTSFPVLFFVVRSVFNGFYSSVVSTISHEKIKDFLENFAIARVLQTLIIFFFIIICAVVIPNISNAISIIGAVSCHFCFTFPGLCFFFLYQKATISNRKHFIRKIGGIFYILLGTFCFGVNFTVAIQSLLKSRPSI
uniref:Slc38a-5 n=1 Tax=Schmidtea mediterranea TaxID=79327 RepID=A0A0H3YJJ8_SCHMD|nr:slc38a-5 [Schmidtea mediterranea]